MAWNYADNSRSVRILVRHVLQSIAPPVLFSSSLFFFHFGASSSLHLKTLQEVLRCVVAGMSLLPCVGGSIGVMFFFIIFVSILFAPVLSSVLPVGYVDTQGRDAGGSFLV